MDWFSVVLVILFVILPIIQQVIEASRKGEAPADAGEALEEGEELPRLERAGEAGDRDGTTTWSDDWLPWPGSEQQEQREPAPSRSREVARVEQTVPAVQDVRRAVVDRLAQQVAVEQRRVTPPVAVRPRPQPRPQGRRRPVNVREALRRSDDVRRALVLAEILGPPASLRRQDPGERDV